MAKTQLSPCLILDGTAAQAIELYQRALGAKTERIMHASEMPNAKPAAGKDPIIHAALRIGDSVLMLMDNHAGQPVAKETNVLVAITIGDLGEATRAFDALAAGGQVTMPLHDAFWGSKFGMVTDAFGVRWMLSCDAGR